MPRSAWLGLAALLLGAVSPAACSGDPEEKAIRALLEETRVAAEAKDFGKVVAPVASSYQDNFGQNRAQLRARLNRLFEGYERLQIRASIEKLERRGFSATAVAKLKVSGVDGKRTETIFGNPLAAKTVEIYLEKRLDRWWITGSLVRR